MTIRAGTMRGVRAAGAMAALVLGAFAGGCVTGAPGPHGETGIAPAEALMLDDLARALEQLHDPRDTTVQVTRGGDALTDAFVERLADAGYGVQRVDADQGAHRVTLAAGEAAPVDGVPVTRLELEVGSTRLARSYALTGEGAGARPAGALSIGGTRGRVRLADARFGDDVDLRHERVVRVGTGYAAARPPLISLITEDVVAGVAREAVGGPSLAAVNSQRVEVPNLFYAADDAFATLDDAYVPAERSVVIFANDSMRLGADGKRGIARFVEGFREDTDLIGLIGCSNGPTALEIGNEGLALGRSRRVAEELVTLGIAAERIVDEGCWAPTSARDRFPSRGVVMELLRKSS